MSQAQIGALRVSLGLDTAEFQNGARRAQSTLGGLTSSLKAFAAGAAGALSLGAVVAGLRSAANHMDDLGKAAQKIGIPVEELSKLEYAARLSDVSLDALTTTVARFSKNLGEIAGGGENSASQAFTALGISAVDAQGKLRPTTEIMSDIAEEFAVMQDGAGKTAIAIALFGKSGADMIPLLNGGREAIKGAGDEAKAFGIVVSTEAAAAAEEFNDNLTRLNTAGQGVAQQIATALLPTMVDLTAEMVNFARESDLAKTVAVEITRFFLEMKSAAFEVGTYIGVMRENFERADGWEAAAQRWKDAFEAIRVDAAKTQAAIAKLTGAPDPNDPTGSLGSIDRMFGQQSAPGKGNRILPPIMAGTSSPSRTGSGVPAIMPITAEDIRGPALELENFNRIAAETNEISFDLAGTLAGTLTDSLKGFIDGTMSASDAFENMKRNLLSTAMDLASGFLKTGINALLFGNEGMVSPSQSSGGLFGGLFGGFRAGGGPVSFGKGYVVGENGPEYFSPGSSGHIIPNDELRGRGGGLDRVIVHNYNGGEVEQRERRNADGGMNTEIFIRKQMEKHAPEVNRKAIPGAFGVSPALINR